MREKGRSSMSRSFPSFETVSELIATAVKRHRQRPAIALPERTLSYGELGDLMAGAATFLHKSGLCSDDRIDGRGWAS